MESLSDHQLRAFAKRYGISPERLRAGLEAEELFASRPELSVSAMRELGRNGELAENYPNFANLIPNLSDGEINRWRENRYSLQLLHVEELPNAGARLRQLRQLLAEEDEFRTRYPAAYRVLQGDMAGASKMSSLYLPSFGVRLARYASWPYSARPGALWPRSPADAYSLLIPRDRPEDRTVDQTFWRLDPMYLLSVLHAIFSRQEVWERVILNPLIRPEDDPLLEGLEAPRRSPVRLTDLRLAIALRPKVLKDPLVKTLQPLKGHVTASRVVEWKQQTLEAYAELPGYGFEDSAIGTIAVSFAAAAMFLFIDFDSPSMKEALPHRLAIQISSLAEVIRKLARSIDRAADDLERVLTHRQANRPTQPESTFYRALCLHRMGWELENIALDTGMTPYRSSRSAPGKGTRDWKRMTLRKIAKGKEVEDERYPRAAAIFANSHNASVRRKAKLAYSTYEKELGDGDEGSIRLAYKDDHYRGFERQTWFSVGRALRINMYSATGLEVAHAYVQLGSCIENDIPPHP
jgi:hypothetical protein